MVNKKEVFEAIVVRVNPPETGKAPGIYISPRNLPRSQRWEVYAHTPSVLPTTPTGGGIQSLPKVGQRCIAILIGNEAFILGYVNDKGISQWGAIFQNPLMSGAVRLSVDGLYESHLKLERGGIAELYSNNEARIGVNGKTETALIRASRIKTECKGGVSYALWNEEEGTTSMIESFSKNAEPLVFSDFKKEAEKGRSNVVPPQLFDYSYGDKVIFKKGFIEGDNVPYLYETRQAKDPLNYHDKNVITVTRTGLQADRDELSEGVLLEFSAKKNIRNSVGTYRSTIGKNPVGDFYHLRLSDNLNNGIPYGQPIWDPLGKGKGWNEEGREFYELGIGERADGTALNEKLKLTPRTGDASEYTRTLFGESMLKINLSKGSSYLNINSSVDDFTVESFLNDKKDTLTVSPDKISLKNDTGSHATLEGDKFTAEAKKLYLGFGDSELIQILSELLLELNIAQTPGYMSPLHNAAKYGALKARVDLLK